VKTFLADAPETLSVLRRAIAQKDAEALAVTAHSFKGSLGIVGAQKAAALAANLQAMGRSGDLAGAAAEFRTLEDEFNSVRGELLTLQAATPPKAKPARKFAAKSRLKR
jgi:HPt (histidine-containing phosphotransfer) domain-containing protein